VILVLANVWWLCLGDVNTMLFHVQSSLTLMLMSRDNNNIKFIDIFDTHVALPASSNSL